MTDSKDKNDGKEWDAMSDSEKIEALRAGVSTAIHNGHILTKRVAELMVEVKKLNEKKSGIIMP